MRIVSTSVVTLAALLGTAAMVSGCGGGSEAGGADEEPAKLYLAGDGEMWVVDVASEDARHIPIRQLVPGDPPHRVAVRGDRLVLWGYDTFATSADHPGRELETVARDSWIWIPSDDPEAVWVGFLEHERPNRPGPTQARGLGELREIAADGTVLTRGVEPPNGAWPYAALTDGLLFTPPGPVVLIDPASGRVVRRVPWQEIGDTGPVHGNVLVSSINSSPDLTLTDFGTGDQRRITAPEGYAFEPWSAEFAPDGELLSVPVVARGRGYDSAHRLALVSMDDGEVSIVPDSEVPGGYVMVAWSASGDQVFMTGGERFQQRVIVARDFGSENARRLDVDVGDFYDVAAR